MAKTLSYILMELWAFEHWAVTRKGFNLSVIDRWDFLGPIFAKWEKEEKHQNKPIQVFQVIRRGGRKTWGERSRDA